MKPALSLSQLFRRGGAEMLSSWRGAVVAALVTALLIFAIGQPSSQEYSLGVSNAAAGKMLDELLGFLTALFTGTLALFAFVQVRDSRRSSEQQLRAYVWLRAEGVDDFAVGKIPYVKIETRNAGQTPAYHLEVTAACLVCEYPLPADTPFPDIGQSDPGTAMVLHPGTEPPYYARAQWNATEEQAKTGLTQAQFDSLVSGNTVRLYAFALVTYLDAFKKRRETKFCSAVWLIPTPNKAGRFEVAFEGAPIHNTAT